MFEWKNKIFILALLSIVALGGFNYRNEIKKIFSAHPGPSEKTTLSELAKIPYIKKTLADYPQVSIETYPSIEEKRECKHVDFEDGWGDAAVKINALDGDPNALVTQVNFSYINSSGTEGGTLYYESLLTLNNQFEIWFNESMTVARMNKILEKYRMTIVSMLCGGPYMSVKFPSQDVTGLNNLASLLRKEEGISEVVFAHVAAFDGIPVPPPTAKIQ